MNSGDSPELAPISSHLPPDIGPGRTSLFEFDLASLTAEVEAMGLPRRTAPQLLKWIYEKGVTDFEKMSDLSKDARAQVAARFAPLQGSVIPF